VVLSQPEIREAVRKGEIVFDPPLEETQFAEASVDLRLGYDFTIFKEGLTGIRVSIADGLKTLGEMGVWISKTLREKDEFGNRETFLLGPNKMVLAFTYEKISIPNNLIALIEGRSTYARVGLSMHQTAPWVQPGWSGPLILEITNQGPLEIYLTPKVDKPCQLTFLKLSEELPAALSYGSKSATSFQNQTHPLKQTKK